MEVLYWGVLGGCGGSMGGLLVHVRGYGLGEVIKGGLYWGILGGSMGVSWPGGGVCGDHRGARRGVFWGSSGLEGGGSMGLGRYGGPLIEDIGGLGGLWGSPDLGNGAVGWGG